MPCSTVEQKEEMSCLTIHGMELSNAMFNRGTVEEMSCLTIHGMELSNATFNRGTEGRNVMFKNSRYGTK